ncbi:hypothetical protein Tco_0097900, partial [Tanacetum coccineum]
DQQTVPDFDKLSHLLALIANDSKATKVSHDRSNEKFEGDKFVDSTDIVGVYLPHLSWARKRSALEDLKTLLRNPPLVKIPKPHDLISANPLLGALPSAVCEQIMGPTTKTIKQRGVAIYREGSKPTGVWLISNAERILSILGTYHVVEDFIWQVAEALDEGRIYNLCCV